MGREFLSSYALEYQWALKWNFIAISIVVVSKYKMSNNIEYDYWIGRSQRFMLLYLIRVAILGWYSPL